MYYLIATSLIVLLFSYLFIRRKEAKFSRIVNIKTGERMPGVSYLQSYFFALRRDPTILLKNTKKYGNIYRTRLLSTPSVITSDLVLAKQVLKKIEEYPKFDIINRNSDFAKIFGNRAVSRINQPEWHHHRSLLNKAFTSNKVFFIPMQKKVLQCVLKWKDGENVDIGENIQKMTLDVLATCIFGRDFDTLNGHTAGPLASYNYFFHNIFTPFRLLVPIYNKLPLPSNTKLRKCAAEFDDYCWSIINDAKNECKKEEPTSEDDSKHLPSLTKLMIESGLDDRDIRDNVGLFFLAGHETTSSTLSWILGLLASHPEVQQKARKEILEKTPNGLTYESLKDFEYLDWIIHETMRMYPAVSLLPGRYVPTETILGDWKIPENTIIQLDFVSILYNEQIWGDPKIFRPERWSPDVLTKEQRSAWIPFSYGPRICIGMNFSLVEQKIFLATLLKEYSQIELTKDSILTKREGFLNVPDTSKMKMKFVKDS